MESRAREVDLPCVTDSGSWRTGVLENGIKGRNLLKIDERTRVPVGEWCLILFMCAWSNDEGTLLLQKIGFNDTIDPRQAATPDLPSSSTT